MNLQINVVNFQFQISLKDKIYINDVKLTSFDLIPNNAYLVNKTFKFKGTFYSLDVIFKTKMDKTTIISLLDMNTSNIKVDENIVTILNFNKEILEKVFFLMESNKNIKDIRMKFE